MALAMQTQEIQPYLPDVLVGPASLQLVKMTTTEIRQCIAAAFANGQESFAHGLADAALTLHPNSQDIVVIAALLAEVRQDWHRAEELLIQLIEIQGADSTEAAWVQLAKVLRCQGKDADAHAVVDFAITRFPTSAALLTEAQKMASNAALQPAVELHIQS